MSLTAKLFAEKYLKGPLPESYNAAVSMSDEDVIRPLLEQAGFSKMAIEKVRLSSVCATAKEAAAGLVNCGFIFEEIRERNPEMIGEIRCELEKELAQKFGAAPMMAPMSAVICTAYKYIITECP